MRPRLSRDRRAPHDRHLYARDGEIGRVDNITSTRMTDEPSSIGHVEWEARAIRVNLSRDTFLVPVRDLSATSVQEPESHLVGRGGPFAPLAA